MKVNQKDIDKFREGILKSIEDKKTFITHFRNGGSIENFNPKDKRTVVRPIP